jgi:hypothetical protein
MTQSWTQLEGSTVAGYGLQQWLSGDEDGAFFLTSRDGSPAVLKLLPQTHRQQLGTWKSVEQLAHPNLLPLLDCGEADSFIYAVFEYPDDNLAEALAHGGLSEDEKRDVLAAGLDALRYIHSRKMVHGAVRADHVVAVGDRIKLGSDTIHPAADSATTPEDDIRALHGILDLPYVPAAPRPIREPVLPLFPPAAEETPGEPEAARVREALPPARPPRRPEPETVERPAARRGIPLWAYPAAAAVAIGAILAIPRKPASAPAPAPAAVTRPALKATNTSQPAPVALPPSPETAPPARVREPKPSPMASRSTGDIASRPVWRVVAFTYSRYRDAQTKAERINQKLPGLHAAVFTPRGKERPPYFVALGGRMTRAEAVNLQRVAMAKGMPRDTFVRNYSE